jgi:hypothetical protein
MLAGRVRIVSPMCLTALDQTFRHRPMGVSWILNMCVSKTKGSSSEVNSTETVERFTQRRW